MEEIRDSTPLLSDSYSINAQTQAPSFQKDNPNFMNNSSEAETSANSSFTLPSSHKSYKEEDKDKCPFFQMQKAKENLGIQEQNKANEGKIQDELSSSSEDEEGNPKRPRGGCPFLPSNRKKNPGLQHLEEKFSTFYLSRYSAYLEQDNLMSLKRDFSKILRQSPSKKRKIFESYPIYLKHTLFHDDEGMSKIRKKDTVERFFAYDKYRERGNRLYNKKKYSDAIFLYERALSCFKWLEMKDESDNETKENEKKKKKEQVKNKGNESKENFVEEEAKIQEKEEETNATKNIKESKRSKITKKKKTSFWDEADGQYEKDQEGDENEKEKKEEKKTQEEVDKEFMNNQTENTKKSIKDFISSRSQDLAEQEKQRQEVLQRFKEKQSQQSQQHESDSDRSQEDSEDEAQEKQRIQEVDSDNQSMSVEGFEDSERNLSSSEEEKEIDIEEICKKNKNPNETAIIMDEEEKRQLIAQEAFVRISEKEDKEFKKKYRLFITTFTDNNIILKDGEDLVDSNDIDLRQSMLVSVYLSLGVCYLNLGNLKEAMCAFQDARKIHSKGSIPLLRMAQCTLIDKASSYSDLNQALEWMRMSEELKKEEKMFNSGQATVVVMNIMNHQAFFQEIRERLEDKRNKVKSLESERLREMFERVVELNEIAADMIERGIIPNDHDSEISSIIINEKEIEEELSEIIEGKYYTLMESHMYAQDTKKFGKIKQELNKYSETLVLMQFYKNLDFKSYKNNELMVELVEECKLDMENDKNQKRFYKLQQEYMRDTFSETQHNFTIYKWALDDYMERKKKRDEKQAKKEESIPKKDKLSKLSFSNVISSMFSKSSMVQLLLVLLVFYFLSLFLRQLPIFQGILPLSFNK